MGCCALHVFWRDLAEVRSLAVASRYTHKGIGSMLLEACLQEARKMKLQRVFTLTASPEFFTKHGFRKTPKNKLPMKVWSDCIRCNKYPDCNEVALIYGLKK